jgi:hypothetical protein
MRRDIQSGADTTSTNAFPHQLRVAEAKAEEMLVDESATATVKQLGDALTEMEVNGTCSGVVR